MTSISQQIDRHNAARDKIAKEIYSAMIWAAHHGPDPRGDVPDGGSHEISRMRQQARQSADKVLSDIYASGVAASGERGGASVVGRRRLHADAGPDCRRQSAHDAGRQS